MKKFYLFFIACIVSTGSLYAQCTESNEYRVLLVGDSWAAMMNTDGVFNTAFQAYGHSHYKFFTNSTLAENGTTTSDFVQQSRLNEIQTQLLAHPTIDFVHLSIGGNDVLNQWNKAWPQTKTDSLLNEVTARLNTIINFIKGVRPDIKIIWSGYDFPNFGEIIGELGAGGSSHPFYGTWNGMGQPNFQEINGLLNYYSDQMVLLAASDPQLTFVKATGLMQYTFGQTINLTVPPGGQYPQYTAPVPGGIVDYPSPKPAMRNYIITRDCFHLAPEGFLAFIKYQTQKYYQKAMMDDQYFISSGGNMDGSVSNMGNVSTSLKMGTSSGESFSTVLTFNTTTMPDTGASAASIFLRRENLSGTNPIGNNLNVKIIRGNFGASVDVEAADYSAPADAAGTPCQFGVSNANASWIRLDLPTSLLPYIQHTDNTQFIISAPSATGLVTFTGAADPELAPILNIKYGINTVGLPAEVASKDLLMYPNPTNGVLVVDNNNAGFNSVEVYDLPGKVVMKTQLVNKTIDITTLPSGMYMVKLLSDDGNSYVQRVVKR